MKSLSFPFKWKIASNVSRDNSNPQTDFYLFSIHFTTVVRYCCSAMNVMCLLSEEDIWVDWVEEERESRKWPWSPPQANRMFNKFHISIVVDVWHGAPLTFAPSILMASGTNSSTSVRRKFSSFIAHRERNQQENIKFDENLSLFCEIK